MAELRATGAQVALQAGGAQQWVHLLPTGTWTGADGRGPYHLDDPAAVVAASLPQGARPIPIDYDHAMEFAAPRGEASPAAGCIERLEVRADGVWGRVDWTERAAAALKAREYRYLSPVLLHDKQGRVLRLERAGLTNQPNFENLAAVAARESSMDLDKLLAELRTALGLKADADAKTVASAVTAIATVAKDAAKAAGLADSAKPEDVVTAIAALKAGTATAAIAKAAGLAETAKSEEIVTAIAALKAAPGADPDPAKFVPIEEHRALAAKVTKLEEGDAAEKATAAVDAAVKAGKITPAGREWALGYARKDPEGFAAFAKAAPVVVAPGEIAGLGSQPLGAIAGDPNEIAEKARAHQAEQAKLGITVAADTAVRHVMKGASA